MSCAASTPSAICRNSLTARFTGKVPSRRSSRCKCLAFDVFHHKIENAIVGFTVVGNTNGVWVLDRRGGLCLAFEARDRLAFLKVVARENVLANRFNRDLTGGKLVVVRQIDLAHRTAAETFGQQVARREKLGSGQRVLGGSLVLRAGRDLVRITRLTFWTFLHVQTERGHSCPHEREAFETTTSIKQLFALRAHEDKSVLAPKNNSTQSLNVLSRRICSFGLWIF
jgi:hypothetical protein